METGLLKEFIVLSDMNNYVQAAEALFISQPTLSRHIKRLEDDLGIQLFERNSRQVILTPEGQLFLPYARQICALEQEVKAMFRHSSGEDDQVLTIGSIPMVAPYGIMDLLQDFHRLCPEITLNMNILSQKEMKEMLADGRLDFALLREFSRPKDALTRIPLKQDRMVMVLPPSHPLAGEESVCLTQLRDEPLIFPARDTETYHVCLQACRDAGFEPKVSFIGKGPELAIDLASRGMGAAFSEQIPCEYANRQGAAVILPIEPEIPVILSAVYKPENHSRPAEAFRSYLQRRRSPSIFK